MKRSKALTLIELLIAMSIFAVVMVGVYAAFRSGFFGYKSIEDSVRIHQTAAQVLERINLDLRNSFSFYQDDTKFKGDKDWMSFLTTTETFEGDGLIEEYSLVSYQLSGATLARLCRRAKESLSENAGTEPEEMASGIKEFSLSYGYMPVAGKPMEWLDKWDNTKVLPLAVKIKLTIESKNPESFERTVYLPMAN